MQEIFMQEGRFLVCVIFFFLCVSPLVAVFCPSGPPYLFDCSECGTWTKVSLMSSFTRFGVLRLMDTNTFRFHWIQTLTTSTLENLRVCLAVNSQFDSLKASGTCSVISNEWKMSLGRFSSNVHVMESEFLKQMNRFSSTNVCWCEGSVYFSSVKGFFLSSVCETLVWCRTKATSIVSSLWLFYRCYANHVC